MGTSSNTHFDPQTVSLHYHNCLWFQKSKLLEFKLVVGLFFYPREKGIGWAHIRTALWKLISKSSHLELLCFNLEHYKQSFPWSTSDVISSDFMFTQTMIVMRIYWQTSLRLSVQSLSFSGLGYPLEQCLQCQVFSYLLIVSIELANTKHEVLHLDILCFSISKPKNSFVQCIALINLASWLSEPSNVFVFGLGLGLPVKG